MHDLLDRHVDRVTHLEGVLTAIFDEFDRSPLNAEELADRGGDGGHWPAEFAAEHARDGLELLVGRAIVDEHANLPATLRHHPWRVADEHARAVGDVDTVDLTGIDVEGEDETAPVFVGRGRHRGRVAGAERIA